MNEKYKKDFIHAGKIAREVRAFGKALIKPGASYNDVIDKINKKILELDGVAAFPPQIALNTVAAHFLPQPDEDIIFEGQVAKLDVGVCYNGAIGDCAVTVDLSGRYQTLIDATEAALLAAEKIVKVGLPVREIGKVIEETISSYGFKPIKNLSGHGLGVYKIHAPPSIPNYDNKSSAVIKPGMTFAIEPFATDGIGFIFEDGVPAIYSFAATRPLHTESGKKLLKKVEKFKGLPFAVHNLIDAEWPYEKVAPAIQELVKAGIIHGYAPLIEEAYGIVAQAENSILVDDQGKVFVTTR